MKHFNIFFYIVFILMWGCKEPKNVANQEIQKYKVYTSDYDNLTKKYNKGSILLSLYFTGDCLADFKKSNSISISSCSLKEELLKYYNTTKENNIRKCISQKDIQLAINWYHIDSTLNTVDISNDVSPSFEETIYAMRKGCEAIN